MSGRELEREPGCSWSSIESRSVEKLQRRPSSAKECTGLGAISGVMEMGWQLVRCVCSLMLLFSRSLSVLISFVVGCEVEQRVERFWFSF